jgi:hypothetical protein
MHWLSVLGMNTRDEGEPSGALVGKELSQRVQHLEDELAKCNEAGQVLRKRTKELDCLYSVLEIINHSEMSLEGRLQRVVSSLPKGWQHSEIASARLEFQGRVYISKGFEGGPFLQGADITVDGNKVGRIEIYYGEEKPEEDEGPFLKEERRLIDAIARRISTFIARRRAEEGRELVRRRLQEALTKILSGFLPICAKCKRIRDDHGLWIEIEPYIRDHTNVKFSHSICPHCMQKLYPCLGERHKDDSLHIQESEKIGIAK